MFFDKYNEVFNIIEKEAQDAYEENDGKLCLKNCERLLLVQTMKIDKFIDVLKLIRSLNSHMDIYIMTEDVDNELWEDIGVSSDNLLFHQGRYTEKDGTDLAGIIDEYQIDSVCYCGYKKYPATYINVMGFIDKLSGNNDIRYYYFSDRENCLFKYKNFHLFYRQFSIFLGLVDYGIYCENNELWD